MTDVLKTASKRSIQKTREGTGDLMRNKIEYKIRRITKGKSKSGGEILKDKTFIRNQEKCSKKDIYQKKITNHW